MPCHSRRRHACDAAEAAQPAMQPAMCTRLRCTANAQLLLRSQHTPRRMERRAGQAAPWQQRNSARTAALSRACARRRRSNSNTLARGSAHQCGSRHSQLITRQPPRQPPTAPPPGTSLATTAITTRHALLARRRLRQSSGSGAVHGVCPSTLLPRLARPAAAPATRRQRATGAPKCCSPSTTSCIIAATNSGARGGKKGTAAAGGRRASGGRRSKWRRAGHGSRWCIEGGRRAAVPARARNMLCCGRGGAAAAARATVHGKQQRQTKWRSACGIRLLRHRNKTLNGVRA